MELGLLLVLIAVLFGLNECSNHSVLGLVPVTLVKPTSDSSFDINNINFTPVSEILIKQRKNNTKPFDFTGPSQLEPLLDQCFLHEDSKYYYRVCPFANVTQHEKSRYAFSYVGQSFHSVLGIWRQWLVVNNTFGPLIYLDGDKCDNGQARKVAVNLFCSHHPIDRQMAFIQNVTELQPCIYLIELGSQIFCNIGTVYSHMDSVGQSEWDLIETLHQRNELTLEGYEYFVQSIFSQYGLTFLPHNQTINTALSETSSDLIQQAESLKCRYKVNQLEMENQRLRDKLKNASIEV